MSVLCAGALFTCPHPDCQVHVTVPGVHLKKVPVPTFRKEGRKEHEGRNRKEGREGGRKQTERKKERKRRAGEEQGEEERKQDRKNERFYALTYF